MSANKQLLSAVKALTSELQKLKVQSRPSAAQPKRKRRRSRKTPSKRASLGPARITGSGVGSSDIVITKTEMVDVVKVAAGAATASGTVKFTTDGDLPWLKVMAASFERSQWRAIRVHYKPGCAMTQAGRITLGFDWDWSGEATTRAKISAYQPNCGGAVFKECSMSVPLNRGPQKWYMAKATDPVNKGPGEVVWAVDASTTAELVVGEIWVDYTVVLSGPRA